MSINDFTDIQDLSTNQIPITPSIYDISICEIGVSKINPIFQNSDPSWNKINSETFVLWSGQDTKIDISPSASGLSNLNGIKTPTTGIYNYSYIVLRNTIDIKAQATFGGSSLLGPNVTYYTSGTAGNMTDQGSVKIEDCSGAFSSHGKFTYKIQNFDSNTFYFHGGGDGYPRVQGLLLANDKKTSSNNDSESTYILAVFDCSDNPINFSNASGLNIKILTKNRLSIKRQLPLPNSDWTDASYNNFTDDSAGFQNTVHFETMPFVFRITTTNI